MNRRELLGWLATMPAAMLAHTPLPPQPATPEPLQALTVSNEQLYKQLFEHQQRVLNHEQQRFEQLAAQYDALVERDEQA